MKSSRLSSNSDREKSILPDESSNNNNREQLENLLKLLWELGILDANLTPDSQVILAEDNSGFKSSLEKKKLKQSRVNVEQEKGDWVGRNSQEDNPRSPLFSFPERELVADEIDSKSEKNESQETGNEVTDLSNNSAELDFLWSSLENLLFDSESGKAVGSSVETEVNSNTLAQIEQKSKTERRSLPATKFESEIAQKERQKLAEVESKTEPEKRKFIELEWEKTARASELENQRVVREEKNNISVGANVENKEQKKITPGIVERGEVLTTDSAELGKLRQIIINLEAKLKELENQVYEPTELINPLIPLMTELLKMRVNDSREIMIETLTPVVDELIQERGLYNLRGMSSILAEILPEAITHEIEKQPEAIARAIAPEIAIAIREQIRLQQGAIAKTLGPEMGRAIKAQIAYERDAMVDALYPVIGNTVAKYMTEVVQSINQKVESALSPEGISRKMRAAFQGVSEAELILRESLGFSLQAIFLIHKTSGLLIRDVQPIESQKLEGDMLAGMLTAIRSFVYDCIVQNGEVSELTEIEYGNSKIVIEVAGYCYLAVVIDGAPSKEFIEKMRATLGKIVEEYDREIQEFDGDPGTIPEAIEEFLKALLKADKKTEDREKKTPPLGFLKLGLLLLFLLGIPGGYYQYRSWIARRIETKTAIALDATPELSVYRLVPEFKRDKLILKGRVPSESLRSLAGEVAGEIAPNFDLNNQIIAVDVPTNPELTIAEIERVTSLFNQKKGIEIFARYEAGKVTVNGNIAQISDVAKVTQVLEQVPGVRSVVNVFQLGEPLLKKRIYFDSGSANLNLSEINKTLIPISELLKQNPQVKLKIIGHADRQGTKEQNEDLAIKRAKTVRDALQKRGIEATRLEIFGSPESPPNIAINQPLRLSRVVRFEPYISTQEE
ncbi:MAG: OmpA family protein [Kamptonema sp. SIO1D9]|nr:OmpA family protein [Kamptonema sp. SIO1D9]